MIPPFLGGKGVSRRRTVTHEHDKEVGREIVASDDSLRGQPVDAAEGRDSMPARGGESMVPGRDGGNELGSTKCAGEP